MREHLAAPWSKPLRRAGLVTALLVAAGALLLPSTSAAVGAHPKAARHKKRRAHRAPQKPGLQSHGQRLRLIVNTNQSSNWFGYNQGTLEQGGKLFNSISANWRVPKATQHTKGQAESSADWIGIGGGCVDSGCAVSDPTLIQTGTEQDVSSSGAASYSAWYELIPAPSFTVSMTVKPGDLMHASISEVSPVPELWAIMLKDLTRHESFSTTTPYASTHATAEWIEETPLVLGSNAGFAALPKLSKVPFTSATTNGAPAHLSASEAIDLVDSNGKVIGAPSAPTAGGSAFHACAWASTCH